MSFKEFFEQDQGMKFMPSRFRRYRLQLIDHADAFIVLRTGLSESGAFELAYNIFSGRKAPIFLLFGSKLPFGLLCSAS